MGHEVEEGTPSADDGGGEDGGLVAAVLWVGYDAFVLLDMRQQHGWLSPITGAAVMGLARRLWTLALRFGGRTRK